MKKKLKLFVLINIFTLFLIGVLIMIPSVYALPQGISGGAEDGCGPCHGSSPSTNTTVIINGLPSVYEPNTEYSLIVQVTSTDVPGNDGGVDVAVTGGTLVITDTINTRLLNGEVVQTDTGSHQRTWSFNWTAPTSGSIIFYAAGLASNNDGGGSGDAWATNSYSLGIIPEFTTPTLLLALTTLTILTLFFRKRCS